MAVTTHEQMNNQRRTRRVKIDEYTLTFSEWATVSGVNKNAIRSRIDLGWSPRSAVFAPLMAK